VTTTFIVLSVVLLMALGVAMLVAIDHHARLPGPSLRRDHPRIVFVVTFVLMSIIAAILLQLALGVMERFRIFAEEEKPELLPQLREDRFTERMRHFHNEPARYEADFGKKTACFYCHGDYPHSKRAMVRTLLNMHTQFIGCMTCHTDPEKIPESSYKFGWINFSGIEVTGPPYGTSIDPATGLLVATDDYFSKIVTYSDDQGDPRLLELTEDAQEVRDFAQLSGRGDLSEQDAEAIKIRFHAAILRKGRTCSRCHVAENKGYLPFRQLRFSEQRVDDLTSVDIVGIVEKYREFHLPLLYERRIEPADANAAGGDDNAAPQPDTGKVDGVRSQDDTPEDSSISREWGSTP
jgi:hypothetical protein